MFAVAAIIVFCVGVIMLGVSAVLAAQRPKTVVIGLPGIKLSPAELRASFNVPDTNRLWMAVLQVIDDIEGEALDAAQKSVASHGICASCVGGTEFLTRLRDRMILEREAAIKQPVAPVK